MLGNVVFGRNTEDILRLRLTSEYDEAPFILTDFIVSFNRYALRKWNQFLTAVELPHNIQCHSSQLAPTPSLMAEPRCKCSSYEQSVPGPGFTTTRREMQVIKDPLSWGARFCPIALNSENSFRTYITIISS